MNPTSTAQLINEVIALILSGGPLVLNFFLKIEGLLNLGPDEKQNIANAIASANATDQDTINKVGAWMAANGFVAKVSFVPKPV